MYDLNELEWTNEWLGISNKIVAILHFEWALSVSVL